MCKGRTLRPSAVSSRMRPRQPPLAPAPSRERRKKAARRCCSPPPRPPQPSCAPPWPRRAASRSRDPNASLAEPHRRRELLQPVDQGVGGVGPRLERVIHRHLCRAHADLLQTAREAIHATRWVRWDAGAQQANAVGACAHDIPTAVATRMRSGIGARAAPPRTHLWLSVTRRLRSRVQHTSRHRACKVSASGQAQEGG